MRKAARLMGLIWMAVVATLACAALITNAERFASFHLLIPVLLFGMAPGAILFAWGRGPYVRRPTVTEWKVFCALQNTVPNPKPIEFLPCDARLNSHRRSFLD